MKTKAALLAALAALAANAAQMATENWVSNRLTEATAPIRESVAALNSATQTLQSAVGSLAGNVYTKQETDDKIVELAPTTSLEPATNYTDRATNEVLKSAIRADAAALSAFASTGAVARASVYGTPTRWTDATGCVWEVTEDFTPWAFGDGIQRTVNYLGYSGGWWAYFCDSDACGFSSDEEALAATTLYFPNLDVSATRTKVTITNLVGRVALTNDISQAISTNNSAFVSAVLAAPLVGADAGDLAELSEYGSYGTVGAAIFALIAGLAALKRRMTSAETAIDGKQDKYPMVAVTPSSGTLTVTPYTVATYTAGSSAAAFTVAVVTGVTGRARDCELVIDCSATGAVAPTVTWPATFHPRTDAGTDFACEAGVRNVYYISEYATGEFAVGGWQETAGGNA